MATQYTSLKPIIYTLTGASPPELVSLLATHGLSLSDLRFLRGRARAAQERAYCPYSRFRVGACVMIDMGGQGLDSSATVIGANVENAAYPVGSCAERVALAKAVVDGLVKVEGREAGGTVRVVAIATDAATPASPCGMCRQL